jgi:tight adherence protein C
MIFHTCTGEIFKKNQAVQIRLDMIGKQGSREAENELNQPLFIRVLRPMFESISKTVLRITPKEIVASMEKKVMLAGKSNNLSVKKLVNIQVIAVVGLPLLTLFLAPKLGAQTKVIIYFIFIEVALGLILPNFVLSKKITARQKRILNNLPDTIDLLTVSVEAGLGFDGALAKVIDKMPGPLADEFENVLQEIKVGKQKRDALRDMSDRIGVQDLSTFVSSIIQADQFGVSIGNVLRIQSDQMRQKRRQRAQEKAMKAPVKMVIPMVLFIFPTLFSVLLGPVVIQIMNTFKK